MNGKGDRPRNCFSKEFKKNYDEIEWRTVGTYCYSCGADLNLPHVKQHPQSYIIYPDGHVEHKKCKFS